MNRVVTVAAAAATLVRCRAAGGAVVLGYHDVVARDAEGLTVTATALRGHIRLLRRLGLRIAPLDELCRRLLVGDPATDLAVLTFDDGLSGVHRHALAVLAEEGAPATLFAVSDRWGVVPRWWPGSGRVMTRGEFRDVVAAGVAIEAHTRTHPSLPGLADADLRRELHDCRRELEDLGGAAVRAVAYPDGHHDRRVRAAARDAGYELGFTFLNGRIASTDDPFRLPRLTMHAGHTVARLAYHLARPAASWPDHQLAVVDPVAAPASAGR